MDEINFTVLLREYRKLWNNRQLSSNLNAEENLKEAILRELRDENTHPRVRKTFYEKYYLGTKRIIESTLENEDKIKLMHQYKELMISLEKENESR
ncbi:MAG: hypothetical protein ACQEXB_00955 [Bacillota bacterium]